MAKPDKYYLELQQKLANSNAKELIETIKEIKHSGKPQILPLVIRLLNKHKSDEVGKEVLILLGQLKDVNVIPFIIDEIKSTNSDAYKAELIMTCWQSGLDYSEYITDFTQEFISGDFQASIESFSVIEEWIHNATKETVEQSRKLLINNLENTPEEKKAFYIELIKLVESYL